MPKEVRISQLFQLLLDFRPSHAKHFLPPASQPTPNRPANQPARRAPLMLLLQISARLLACLPAADYRLTRSLSPAPFLFYLPPVFAKPRADYHLSSFCISSSSCLPFTRVAFLSLPSFLLIPMAAADDVKISERERIIGCISSRGLRSRLIPSELPKTRLT